MEGYDSPEYWEQKYQNKEHTEEWYYSYQQLKQIVTPHFKKTDKVLCVGNGTSSFPVELSADFKPELIISTDISASAVEQMQKFASEKVKFVVDDALHMNLQEQFDVVFDKGCFDAISTSANRDQIINQYINEISRVLKQGGKYIMVSYGKPYTRVGHFGKQWDTQIVQIPDKAPSGERGFAYIFQLIKQQ
ncbi:Methyltransferase [Hexamita inflata]|uniref:Methyltransferase n=2 Tax=Hexamita inflata TaxID=28002 RepID=A0AA86TVD1_9EUKA|nr:Methyltransferase [Hexamita inflata]